MYIGNDLQVAFSTYKNIDDISGSFNGVTTSFALLVNGVAPAPLPLNSNQCLISVGGVVQRPDDTGTEGFRLSGGNIVFSSAPNTAEDFFGVILAGADYVNAGVNFPDGTLAAPSITFDQDNDTGYYRSGSGSVSFASNGVAAGTWSSTGLTAPAFIPTGSSVPANGVYLPGTNRVGLSTNSTARLEVDASGRLLVGTSSADTSGNALLQVNGSIKGTITSGTSVASTSGTSIDFTGIPSWVKRVTVVFNGVSTNGTSILLVQLGDSGGVETTGYLGSVAIATTGNSTGATTSTAGFPLVHSLTISAVLAGALTVFNVSGDSWVSSWAGARTDLASGLSGAGTKTLSGTLDRIRITTTNGTDTFDAGSINILYEG